MVTREQVSAGGVAFRRAENVIEVALVRVGDAGRWQLPKGLVEQDEPPEDTAVREVREEAGIETDLIGPIEVIEYWYVASRQGQKIRYHKFVHFFLLAYRRGRVEDHDDEVQEAQWVEIEAAVSRLAFKNERAVVARAKEMIWARP